MTSEINFTGRSAPRGIVAPGPRVQLGIKQGDSFQIRPGEPLYVFVPLTVGTNFSFAQMEKSAFSIGPSQMPPGVGTPRIAGEWFQISMTPGVREGTREEVRLQTKATPEAVAHTALTFTLVTGGRRFY
ncbi:MAG: hypothetical protein ACAI38_25880 [Myxococcota bacterium]|nr:hypothetical protein [Myxococcota bacterium]